VIKKINKERGAVGWMLMPDWYKTASDYTKISIQVNGIRIMLEDLKSRLSLSSLRLRHVLLYKHSKQRKAGLKLQKRIVDEHINQIEKLLEENENLRRENFTKEYGEDYYKFNI
tara:strand:+ start:955 stop:1296 length:342 start_codon:yes stop_codon:yes gene_type:complete